MVSGSLLAGPADGLRGGIGLAKDILKGICYKVHTLYLIRYMVYVRLKLICADMLFFQEPLGWACGQAARGHWAGEG